MVCGLEVLAEGSEVIFANRLRGAAGGAGLAEGEAGAPVGKVRNVVAVLELGAEGFEPVGSVESAEEAGGVPLPAPVRGLMRAMSRVMTTTAYRI